MKILGIASVCYQHRSKLRACDRGKTTLTIINRNIIALKMNKFLNAKLRNVPIKKLFNRIAIVILIRMTKSLFACNTKKKLSKELTLIVMERHSSWTTVQIVTYAVINRTLQTYTSLPKWKEKSLKMSAQLEMVQIQK